MLFASFRINVTHLDCQRKYYLLKLILIYRQVIIQVQFLVQ